MPNQTDVRLGHIRGSAPPKNHDARTIAALTRNPGCARRAVLDAAGVDKEHLARRVGFPPSFGQSPFAIARGHAFEARIKADGCAELLHLLRENLGIDLPEVSYADLGAPERNDTRYDRSRARLLEALGAAGGDHARTGGRASLFAHPLLRMPVAGQDAYLEPDLVAVQPGGTIHVIEVKSFPVIDGRADGAKAAAAATQAAVYVLALRRMPGRPQPVSHEVVLVCPKDFSNIPVATKVDVRRQVRVLEHQLARLTRIEALLDARPDELTFDMPPAGPAGELAGALGCLPARYVPECLSFCEMAFFCRHEAAGCTAALGVGVREQLGGVATVAEALGLADGTLTPADGQAEAAALLRTTARLYASALATATATAEPATSPGAPKAPKAPSAPGVPKASTSGTEDEPGKPGRSSKPGRAGKARGLREEAT